MNALLVSRMAAIRAAILKLVDEYGYTSSEGTRIVKHEQNTFYVTAFPRIAKYSTWRAQEMLVFPREAGPYSESAMKDVENAVEAAFKHFSGIRWEEQQREAMRKMLALANAPQQRATEFRGMLIVELSTFPPGSNPYCHDYCRQGTVVGDDDTPAMWSAGSDETVVLVDSTGRRFQIVLPSDVQRCAHRRHETVEQHINRRLEDGRKPICINCGNLVEDHVCTMCKAYQ